MPEEPAEYIYRDLSFKIIGGIYEVNNAIGFGHREIVYQRALSEEFNRLELTFEREKYYPFTYNNKIIARYYADFVIDEKIVLELKVGKEMLEDYVKQIVAYLKISGYKLGIIAVITPKKVLIKRIIF